MDPKRSLDSMGSAPTRRIVLVHGFTQTAACWSPVDDALAADHDVHAIDAPGHGIAANAALDLPTGGRIITVAGGHGAYIGYSMGARFVLHSALAAPDHVERLVLISGTAGIEDTGERAARRASDEALADRIETIGVPAFLDEWLALPLFAGLPPERAHRAEREANTAAGLSSSLRLAGTGTQQPLWDRLPDLAMPVLVVAGAEDPKFTAIGQRMVDAIGPNAEFAVIEGAGHTVHLEQPERFLAALLPWLART